MNFRPGSTAKMRICCLLFASAALGACSTTNLPDAPRTIGAKANPHYKIGAPYKIDGRWYVPKVDENYEETGIASWYGDAFHGKLTANGEIFDKQRLSAAHKTLPLPTLAEVENLENGRRIVVRVNDRGPFVGDRVIDLSHAAADELGFTGKGLARVRVRYVGETDVNRLAALPGEKNASPVKLAAKKTAAAKALAPAADEPDRLAALIAETTGAKAGAGERVAAPLISELWVEIAKLDDLKSLETMSLNLPELGPITVQADHAAGQTRQSLRIGPFIDEAIAVASLSRVQAAGFGGARIVRSAGS